MKGYDGAGHPSGTVVQIPTSETGLSGLHTTLFGWTSTGLLHFVEPASGGGLPGELISTSYTPLGHPASTAGYNAYVDSTSYTPYGEPLQVRLGPFDGTVFTYFRDAQTRRITTVTRAGAVDLGGVDYAYDPAGNVTRSVESDTVSTRTSCYRYDALDRLAEAWTATDNCAADPSTANVGGPNPYWTTWSFRPSGQRDSQVQHALPGQTGGDTTTTYTYGTGGGAQPHTLTGTSTTGPAGTTTTAYTYDSAGNTTTRDLPGDTQTLTWDAENRLASYTTPAGSGDYVYDADGNQLVRHDPDSTTLYLPGEELVRRGDGTITGIRYYTHGGTTVALRVGGANPEHLFVDRVGTAQIAVDSGSNLIVRRTFDPYGNLLGATGGVWPDTHGFLGAPVDPGTGLIDVGARKYDPATGQFISPDPLLDTADPQSLNGYSYADNNPVTNSDPTGQLCKNGPDGASRHNPNDGTQIPLQAGVGASEVDVGNVLGSAACSPDRATGSRPPAGLPTLRVEPVVTPNQADDLVTALR